MVAHLTCTERMKRRHEQASTIRHRGRKQRIDAFTHLTRRLVGEGERQNLPGRNALMKEPSDTTGDDAGLATARAREDQSRPVDMGGRLELGVGQAIKKIFGVVDHGR